MNAPSTVEMSAKLLSVATALEAARPTMPPAVYDALLEMLTQIVLGDLDAPLEKIFEIGQLCGLEFPKDLEN